jgi:hypothetical protein
MVGRVDHDAQLLGALHLMAVHAHVDLALAVAHDGHASRDVAASVQVVLVGEREAGQVDIVVGHDDFLDRRDFGINGLGFLGFVLALDLVFFHVQQVLSALGQGQAIERGVKVDEDREVRALDVLEQERREFALPLQPLRQAGDLVDGIDLTGNDLEFVRPLPFEQVEVGAQALAHV